MNENKDPRKVQQNIETHKVLYFAPSVFIITENKFTDQFFFKSSILRGSKILIQNVQNHRE